MNTAPDGIWFGPDTLTRDVVTIAKRIKVRCATPLTLRNPESSQPESSQAIIVLHRHVVLAALCSPSCIKVCWLLFQEVDFLCAYDCPLRPHEPLTG